MMQKNAWSLWGGLVLIGLGILFFMGQLFGLNVWGFIWPFFIIVAGSMFFVGMISGGRSTAALAIPGSVIVTIGLILLVQNVFNIWSTWAYAWTLLMSAAGVGLVIAGNWGGQEQMRRVGRGIVLIGVVFFIIFGVLFEFGALLLGTQGLGSIFWGILLIIAGVIILFSRVFTTQVSGPVSRTPVPFSSPTGSESNSAQSVHVYNAAPAAGASAHEQAALTSSIRRVKFRTVGEMTIVQGEPEFFVVEANEAFKSRLRTTVQGDTLDIWYDHEWWDWFGFRFLNLSRVRYQLTLPALDVLDISGLGDIRVPNLQTTHFALRHAGAGNVSVNHLQAETLSVDLSGLGNATVSGQVAQQNVVLNGAGSYSGRDLTSQVADIHIAGLGSATVWVQEQLEASISGAGSIDYYGSPQVNRHISGLGSIHDRG